MTRFLKNLTDRLCGGKRPSAWRIIVAVICFIAVSVPTFGANPASLAVLMLLPDGWMLSGRSKGTVFQRNGIRRNFAMSPNPQTPFQTIIRNYFGSFSSLWRTLTVSQQTLWRNLKMTITNRVGVSKNISGKEVYVRLNTNLAIIGGLQIDDAPTLSGVIAPESSGVVIDVSATEIDANLTNADASMGVALYASLPLLDGRTTSRTALVYAVLDSTAYNAVSAWNGYVAKWGYTPVAADRIIVEARYINKDTGEGSPNGSRGIVNVQA